MQRNGLFAKNANVLFGEKSRQNDSMIKFLIQGTFLAKIRNKNWLKWFIIFTVMLFAAIPIQRLSADEIDKYCYLTYI